MNQNETFDPQAILAEVFEFSPADIAANRKGNLSAAQKARMTRKHHADARAARNIFVIVFVMGFLGFSVEMIRIGNMSVRSSVSTSNCLWQLRVRPRGVEIDPLSAGETILELLVDAPYFLMMAFFGFIV
jgi:hypothetical protein